MAEVAKIFMSGGSQAVRLPRKYRFPDQEEVRILREGHRVILEPVRKEWSEKFLSLAGSAPDFPERQAPAPVDSGPDFD
jgi:antitoxin VapB